MLLNHVSLHLLKIPDTNIFPQYCSFKWVYCRVYYLTRDQESTSSKLEEFQLITNNVMAGTPPHPGAHGEPPQPFPPFSSLPRSSSTPVTGQSTPTSDPSLGPIPVNVGQQSHAPPVDSTENVPKFSRRNADTAPWI